MKSDPATPNHAAGMAAAIDRAARRYDGLLPDLEPILERTSPSLRAVVLTGAAEFLASALDLVRIEPTMHHQNAAAAFADAVCELVASVTRRRCRQCGSDCARCIERTGEPCTWAEADLCSACAEPPLEDTPPRPHPAETIYVGRAANGSPRTAEAPTSTPPPAGKRTTIGDIAREQRDLLQRCLLQTAPALRKMEELLSTLAKAEKSARGVEGLVLVVAPHSTLRTVQDAMLHPGWKAAGISFPMVSSHPAIPEVDGEELVAAAERAKRS